MLYLGGVTLDEANPRRPLRFGRRRQDLACARTHPSSRNYWCHSMAAAPRRTFCSPGWNLAVRRPASGAAAIAESGSSCTAACRPATRPAASAWRSRPRFPTRFTRWWPTGWAARCSASIAAATAASAGRRWAAAHFAAEGQSCYNNTIAVHPDDPDTVVCGLNDIHISRDGGATWRARQPLGRRRGQRRNTSTPINTPSCSRAAI